MVSPAAAEGPAISPAAPAAPAISPAAEEGPARSPAAPAAPARSPAAPAGLADPALTDSTTVREAGTAAAGASTSPLDPLPKHSSRTDRKLTPTTSMPPAFSSTALESSWMRVPWSLKPPSSASSLFSIASNFSSLRMISFSASGDTTGATVVTLGATLTAARAPSFGAGAMVLELSTTTRPPSFGAGATVLECSAAISRSIARGEGFSTAAGLGGSSTARLSAGATALEYSAAISRSIARDKGLSTAVGLGGSSTNVISESADLGFNKAGPGVADDVVLLDPDGFSSTAIFFQASSRSTVTLLSCFCKLSKVSLPRVFNLARWVLAASSSTLTWSSSARVDACATRSDSSCLSSSAILVFNLSDSAVSGFRADAGGVKSLLLDFFPEDISNTNTRDRRCTSFPCPPPRRAA